MEGAAGGAAVQGLRARLQRQGLPPEARQPAGHPRARPHPVRENHRRLHPLPLDITRRWRVRQGQRAQGLPLLAGHEGEVCAPAG